MEDLTYYHLLSDAQTYASNENYKKAFWLYVQAINRAPRHKKRIEHNFRNVVAKLNEEMAASNDKSGIFHNFEIAIKHFPANAYILNDMGKYLYKYGYFGEALCHFEKALKVDSSFVSIEKNLNNAKRFLFPRHYFRTLNDKRKNDAYRRAIKRAITDQVDSVLDLDTGTGLLTLYATASKPISTTACESSRTLAKLAERVMNENEVDAVIVVNKPSIRLTHREIYGSRTLLLTDMFDPGLFGEYILQNLSQAWECLLTEDAKVLPARAKYYIIGVRSEKLREKFQVCESTKKLIGMSSHKVHMTTYYNESYYGEDVHEYEDIEFVTEPETLLTIDFNNYDDIQDKLYRREPYHVELKAVQSGEITAAVGWFELTLADDVTITNDPRSLEKIEAWQPAVFFDFTAREVQVGDPISLDFYTYLGRMSLLVDPNEIVRVSPELLKFLNDKEYIQGIKGSVAMNCIHLGQSVNIDDADIIDLCAFPLFGFEMMKRGARSLVCHAKNSIDKLFIEKVFKENGLAEESYSVMMNEIWDHGMFKEMKFNVIFCNIIDANGQIDVRKRKMAYHLCHSHLNEGGLFLPSNIVLYGQLISSKSLESLNRMCDENIGGFKMADFVNRYQVTHTGDIDISLLDYMALSEPVVMSRCLTHMRAEVIKVPVVRDGECSGILCWYEIFFSEDWRITNTKREGSFLDCSAFLATPPLMLFKGDSANVVRCVDPDGTFKLVLDVDV